MIRRPPRSTQSRSSAASDVYKRQLVCNNGITQFYLPPTHEPYLPLLPSRKDHRPLAGTNLYCLVTEAHRCEKLAQRFYIACPAETRTHDLLIASPTLYRQRHDATCALFSQCTWVRDSGLGGVSLLSSELRQHLSPICPAVFIHMQNSSEEFHSNIFINTRLPSNLRQTTRKRVYLVTLV